jgi:hypothetical protein
VFTPISAILGLLLFASTLPNGIRLVELPSTADSVEIVAGYTAGGLTDFDSAPATKSLLLDAYAAGGKIDFIEERDRTAVRIIAPSWALPMLSDRLPALFKESAGRGTNPQTSFPDDFRAKVEEEIHGALLGQTLPRTAYATDDAFILISAPASNALRAALEAIPKRGSGNGSEDTINRLPAERTLRFRSDLADGAVIFASPIPGVYYKQWYSVLLLDRLIQRIVPVRLKTAMPLSVRPYYYRLELTVPAGQFPEPAEENLLQELQRLQFTPANARDLTAARQDALAYLDSKTVREWFASHDMLARREEGIQWIQSMSADDMRVTARDMLIMNRVIASWPPRPRQTSVTTETLSSAKPVSSSTGRASNEGRGESKQGEPAPIAFPAHTHQSLLTPLPERLSSGVSLAASTATAVFVSGGTMTRFDRPLTAEDLKQFQQYRADRILVLAPAADLERARQLWTAFKGSATGPSVVSRGKVSNGDLSALFILKTILDLKVIDAGLWRDVELRIDAGAGSDLQIVAANDKRAQVVEWIKAIAGTALADNVFTLAREIAIHQFDGVRSDLQALNWERDPQAVVQDPETVSSKHVQDVARIYF